MKRLLIPILAAGGMALPMAASAATYYLDANGGSDGNSGTSPGSAWATLSKAGGHKFNPGDRLLLQRGDIFYGKLTLNNDSGTAGNPVVVDAYGTGNRPIIDCAHYQAGVYIANSDYIEVNNLEITGDGGAHVDGTSGTDRYGVFITTWSGNTASGITLSNLYIHAIYPPLDTSSEGTNPTTYMGTGVEARGQASSSSVNLTVTDCHFENLGFKAINLSRMHNASILNNLMENIGGPAMVPGRCNDLLVRGNIVNGSGQYTDPRMHGRGSGIWPFRCNRVLIEKNAFMHARGRYDSCGAHIDIGCTDVVVQYNLSLDNEGGFVEILGENQNCSYRYNISVNDGARVSGVNSNGLSVGDGYVFIFSGHNGSTNRAGPYNSYVYNNTIYVKDDQTCSFGIEQYATNILVANNLFYIEGPAEDGSPSWWANYPADMENGVIWTNNLYQRGGIFPDTWVFTEGHPIFGNPELANPGGLTAADYVPKAGSFVEGRGIPIPKLPGDPLGLRLGLAVTEDFFGNPIQGLPDIGAVEVGGGVSTIPGGAFMNLPTVGSSNAAAMTAVAGPVGTEYRFLELDGNFGGDDSGWQSSPVYTDAGLLPNTRYTYAVTTRDALQQGGNTSVVAVVTPPSVPPFPNHILLSEDFVSRPDPANTAAPFPVNTWYVDNAQLWSSEDQTASVQGQSDETMRLGWGYDEIVLQYFTDRTWDLSRDYTFSGDWKIANVLTFHLGIIVGVGEYDPATGALIQRIKEATFGELAAPFVGQTGTFSLSVSAAELQAAGVSPSSRVGVFIHHDNGGGLYNQTSDKNDVYHVDNLLMQFFGNDIDLDGDGIPDTAETAVGLNPNDPADGSGDLDGDGISNAHEYLIGTAINVADQPLGAGIQVAGGVPRVVVGQQRILTNRVYILEQKESLMSSNAWKAVDAMSGTAEAGNGDYAFPGTGSATQSFYRIRVDWE